MGMIIKPLVTEKMTAGAEKFNRFGFIVRPEANKLEINQLAESLYPCVNLLVADNVFLCGLSVILPVFQAFLSNLQPLILACFP